jgi:hypothetical protein
VLQSLTHSHLLYTSATISPTPATSTLWLHVLAPMTLPEGYKLSVQIHDINTITTSVVVVPSGGVQAGHTFCVPWNPSSDTTNDKKSVDLPVGAWRDGLCDCFHYGICHPHLWTTFLFPAGKETQQYLKQCAYFVYYNIFTLSPLLFFFNPLFTVAAGQVMSRLQLPWTGLPPADGTRTTGSFQVFLVITGVYGIVYFILKQLTSRMEMNYNTNTLSYLLLSILKLVWHYAFVFLTAWCLYNLRKTVRAQSAISTQSAYEDAVCSLCCPYLVAGQLLRHTTDYDVYPAMCCTEFGISSNASYSVNTEV